MELFSILGSCSMEKCKEKKSYKLTTGKMACKCLECGLINVYPTRTVDGNTCMRCSGAIVPIGYAVIKESKADSIAIDVKVNTNELDSALDKARELNDIIDGLKCR